MPDTISPDTVDWLIAVWLFVFGGVIGSFLNVVVYRLPAGMSLIEPGSHCPACKTPIRWFDNVPILGWLMLRGRCRDCRAKISPRYPLVEAITATLFLVLGVVECLWDGVNLPLRTVPMPDGAVFTLRPAAELWWIYAYHLLLLCTLLTAALIEYDRYRLPRRLFLPAVLIGFCAPLAWPGLRPVAALGDSVGRMAGLVDGMAGLGTGAMLGLLAWRISGEKRQRTGTILGPACVGLFLGWQGVAAVVIVTGAICLLLLPLGRLLPGIRRTTPVAWLALATLGWILILAVAEVARLR